MVIYEAYPFMYGTVTVIIYPIDFSITDVSCVSFERW